MDLLRTSTKQVETVEWEYKKKTRQYDTNALLINQSFASNEMKNEDHRQDVSQAWKMWRKILQKKCNQQTKEKNSTKYQRLQLYAY